MEEGRQYQKTAAKLSLSPRQSLINHKVPLQAIILFSLYKSAPLYCNSISVSIKSMSYTAKRLSDITFSFLISPGNWTCHGVSDQGIVFQVKSVFSLTQRPSCLSAIAALSSRCACCLLISASSHQHPCYCHSPANTAAYVAIAHC